MRKDERILKEGSSNIILEGGGGGARLGH